MGSEYDTTDEWRALRVHVTRMVDSLATFRESGAAFIEYDLHEGRLLGVSRALRCELGYDPIGMLTTELCHPDDVRPTMDSWAALRSGEPVTCGFPNRYRCADDSWLWILWSPPVTPLGSVGAAFGIIVHDNPHLRPALDALAVERAK